MSKIIEKWGTAAALIAIASKGNPVIAIVSVWLYWFAFNGLMAMVEYLVWGKPFLHWIDPLVALIFIAFAGRTGVACAHFNAKNFGGQQS